MISTATNTLQATANMTANPIRYHTNDVRSLMKSTLAGLEASSVTASGLGERRNGKFVLRGGGYLTPYSRSILSVHMGGDALAVPATLDPRTVHFLDIANAMSPAGFKGLTGRERGSERSDAAERSAPEPRRDLTNDLDHEQAPVATPHHPASDRTGMMALYNTSPLVLGGRRTATHSDLLQG